MSIVIYLTKSMIERLLMLWSNVRHSLPPTHLLALWSETCQKQQTYPILTNSFLQIWSAGHCLDGKNVFEGAWQGDIMVVLLATSYCTLYKAIVNLSTLEIL